MMNFRHHPSYHGFVEGSAKVIELVEDMRPFVHIFFLNIFTPVMVMIIANGTFKAIRHENTNRINAPGFKAIQVVAAASVMHNGPVTVPFRHHGMHR